MQPALAFDLTRLFIGPLWRTPRGIDRQDAGLAQHVLARWPGECVATLPLPWGVRTVSRKSALAILESANAHWGESADPDKDMLLDAVTRRIVGRGAASSVRAQTSFTQSKDIAASVTKILRQAGCTFGPAAASAVPKGALYLNTGQIGLAIPSFLSWLKRRSDVKAVFMLHDTIPLDHAEFVSESSPAFHQSMIAGAARYASGLIVTTKAAQVSITRELNRCGRDRIPVLVEPLPVPPAFARGPDPDEELAATPYFVVLGAIEPRKNHLLLLNVWRELVARGGKRAPKLIVAGKRWHAHEAVTRVLERSKALSSHVIEVSGLSSPSLRRLISNACGLLMPSFAEGFGLPIVEALALGTPVIASDLEAHREAGGAYATYLSPIDGLGWLSAIDEHLREQAALRQRLANYPALSWADYAQRLDAFLGAIHAGPADVDLGQMNAQYSFAIRSP